MTRDGCIELCIYDSFAPYLCFVFSLHMNEYTDINYDNCIQAKALEISMLPRYIGIYPRQYRLNTVNT